MIAGVTSSTHCKESYLSLKYEYSLREFMSYREHIQILDFLDAARDFDEYKEMQKAN